MPAFDLKVKYLPQRPPNLSITKWAKELPSILKSNRLHHWGPGLQLQPTELAIILDRLQQRNRVYMQSQFKIKPHVLNRQVCRKFNYAIKCISKFETASPIVLNPKVTLVYRPKQACIFASPADLTLQNLMALEHLKLFKFQAGIYSSKEDLLEKRVF